MDAVKSAPAYRMTVLSTDSDTKKTTTITMEMVNPNSFHMQQEEGGAVQMEIVTDGKTTYWRHGAGAKLELAPPAVSSMIATIREKITADTAAEGFTNVKADGHETVGGVPTSVYTAEHDRMGLHTKTRMWVSDQDHLPLKTEGDTSGETAIGNRPGRKVNRHTVATFDYDPSIKVTLPDGH